MGMYTRVCGHIYRCMWECIHGYVSIYMCTWGCIHGFVSIYIGVCGGV